MTLIAQSLKETLQVYGLSAVRLSEVSGVHRSRVSEIINGKNDPRAKTIVALLSGLEVLQPGARLYFCMLLAHEPGLVPAVVSVDAVSVQALSLIELSTLYGLLAARLHTECLLRSEAALKQPGVVGQELTEKRKRPRRSPTTSRSTKAIKAVKPDSVDKVPG